MSSFISQNCNYLDCQNNKMTQICWSACLILLVLILTILIYSNCAFYKKAKIISQKWRDCIKKEIDENIKDRRIKSPQHLFEITYQNIDGSKSKNASGLITIKKGAGSTPIPNERQSSIKFEVISSQNVQKKKRKSHVTVPSISEYPEVINREYLNEDNAENRVFDIIPESQPLNPPLVDYSIGGSQRIVDYSQHRRQIKEYSHSQSNLNIVQHGDVNEYSHSQSHVDIQPQILYSQSQMNYNLQPQHVQMAHFKNYSKSHTHLNYKPIHNEECSQLAPNNANHHIMQSQSMQELPPVIRNPIDILNGNTQNEKYKSNVVYAYI